MLSLPGIIKPESKEAFLSPFPIDNAINCRLHSTVTGAAGHRRPFAGLHQSRKIAAFVQAWREAMQRRFRLPSRSAQKVYRCGLPRYREKRMHEYTQTNRLATVYCTP